MSAFTEGAQLWANTVLMWIGFGTVVGLAAKAIMPGRDQSGALATLLMGIGGSLVGMGLLAFFWNGLILLGFGLLLGAMGSGVTIRRFLRV